VTDELFESTGKEEAIAQDRAAHLISELIFPVGETADAAQIVGEVGGIQKSVFEYS